jgi:hypothetical protein
MLEHEQKCRHARRAAKGRSDRRPRGAGLASCLQGRSRRAARKGIATRASARAAGPGGSTVVARIKLGLLNGTAPSASEDQTFFLRTRRQPCTCARFGEKRSSRVRRVETCVCVRAGTPGWVGHVAACVTSTAGGMAALSQVEQSVGRGGRRRSDTRGGNRVASATAGAAAVEPVGGRVLRTGVPRRARLEPVATVSASERRERCLLISCWTPPVELGGRRPCPEITPVAVRDTKGGGVRRSADGRQDRRG